MLDFLTIATKSPKKGIVEIFPKFIVKKTNDLMIRGGDFYAVWDEDLHLWATDEDYCSYLIDTALDDYAKSHSYSEDTQVKVLHMWDSDSGSIDRFHKYCQKQMRDCFHDLDEKLIFANETPKKRDYASKKLPYPLEEGSFENYDELMTVLYAPEERHKLEWAIGSIVAGKSQRIQKFIVMYGAAGTGKSTVLNIISDLFEGYSCAFDAKAIGSATNVFALESFRSNPLVAIQHDGDLSRIEDNTRLNSLVSHEVMTVNEKYAKTYASRFNAFLFMGTNKPVKITDAKSGILRRLIDVSPTGKKIEVKRYRQLVKNIEFELGAIAWHCKEVFEEDPNYYDDYVPLSMIGATNDFYNFMLDEYDIFEQQDGVTLKAAWDLYKEWCEDSKISYPFNKRVFTEELRNYFREFSERYYISNNERVRNYFSGFLTEKFEKARPKKKGSVLDVGQGLIEFSETKSLLDDILKDCPAQYANRDGKPSKAWDDVKTTLKDIQTTNLHYVQPQKKQFEQGALVFVDFDIPDENGNKCYEANLRAASQWPKTYAELSKSGAGIHLTYFYRGDTSKLSSVYDDHIEIKVFTGNSSLRRKLTKCNNVPIATISSGLPLKEDKKVINFDGFKDSSNLAAFILTCVNKKHHGATKPEMDFIYKALTEAYESGMKYDVSELEPVVRAFALGSTNQRDACYKIFQKLHFKSEEGFDTIPDISNEKPIVFYDVEVFPNLFVVCYKTLNKEAVDEYLVSPKEKEDWLKLIDRLKKKKATKLINPTPAQIDALMQYRLVGYNNRRYDNHLIWAAHLGMSNEKLYEISQAIINKEESAFFRDAYNISYTDIYDFSSIKQSLKKFEIQLGIHHQELGLPWDKPVPEELWEKVADYCCNDVDATEVVWVDRNADFIAREILADISGGSVNDTTNQLTGRLIFGNEKNPQKEFHWRDLSQPVYEMDAEMAAFLEEEFPEMMAERHGELNSLLPYFPSYIHEKGKSIYLGEEVGEGGLVRAKPGYYEDVVTYDVTSEHPHSAKAEYIFGKYTKIFRDLIRARVLIKKKDYEAAGKLFGGKLKKWLTNPEDAKALAGALKIAINSVYGLTAAKFANLFKDPNNTDNIVAKRGALFMLDLMYAVESMGFEVVHIKTDSIKIAHPTPEIEKFVYDFGKRYGYTFEVEHKFEKFCLVNNAVYIAKCACDDPETPGEWTATGAEFAVPYIFKTLFSKEPITFDDLCETKEVKAGDIYLDMNEDLPQLTPDEEKLLEKMKKVWNSDAPNELEKLQKKLNISFEDMGKLYSDLCAKEQSSHNHVFIGRIGQFCPMKPGAGGGVLYRVQNGKAYAISGTTGYRWLESEMVKTLHKEDLIDKDYFRALVDSAKASIEEFVHFDDFVD